MKKLSVDQLSFEAIVKIIVYLSDNCAITSFVCNNVCNSPFENPLLDSTFTFATKIEETFEKILLNNYTITHFYIRFNESLVKPIKLENITNRNKILASNSRFVKTKVACN